MSSQLETNCVYCKTISERIRQGLDIEEVTLNGWHAAKHVHAMAFVQDPELIEQFGKLASYELSSGRWCKGCFKKVK